MSPKTIPIRGLPLPSRELLPFSASLDHVLAEISWVELLVRAQLGNISQPDESTDQYKGLVITDQEIRNILDRPPGSLPFSMSPASSGDQDHDTAPDRLRAEIAGRCGLSIEQGIELRLVDLQRAFDLSDFDTQCLMICLAAEIDPRFELLYAYLQDDATRKFASVHLVLNLLCRSFPENLRMRERFADESPLRKYNLLTLPDDPSHGSGTLLGKALRVDERIVRHLLGSDASDSRISGFTHCLTPHKTLDDLVFPQDTKARISALTARKPNTRQATVIHLRGSYGSGRQSTAEALCQSMEHPLLHVSLDALLAAQTPGPNAALGLAVREAMLRGSALYLDGFDLLLADDKAVVRKTLLLELADFPGTIFFAGGTIYHPLDELGSCDFISIEFDRPDYTGRLELWRRQLGTSVSAPDCAELAGKFRFTGGQIEDASRTANEIARWRDPANAALGMADLYESCRIHSSRKLSTLGNKIKPHHTWTDLVLPEDRTLHLREICNWVKYRSVVFEEWGFDRKLSLGKGLNMLFAGPSGTGKTMAAEVMAGEVGLEVYKIDLSTIVSKYIGETEKNLARIFAEAELSNAILFFDEADSLFGKRTEVRDSHDRYANIEVNYLLQKMEEHEGVVILATNFRKNMDDAFVRRMHFTVEFPLPSEADRRRIWENIFPKEIPHGADLDLDFLARRFEMPGGNIRNVAMAAAFLAASDGGVVTMSHLLHGTRREYQKMGKVVMQGEFG